MFLSRKKKNIVHPCKHQFYYIKVDAGSKLYMYVFVMEQMILQHLIRVYTDCHSYSRFKINQPVVKWTCPDSRINIQLTLINFEVQGAV